MKTDSTPGRLLHRLLPWLLVCGAALPGGCAAPETLRTPTLAPAGYRAQAGADTAHVLLRFRLAPAFVGRRVTMSGTLPKNDRRLPFSIDIAADLRPVLLSTGAGTLCITAFRIDDLPFPLDPVWLIPVTDARIAYFGDIEISPKGRRGDQPSEQAAVRTIEHNVLFRIAPDPATVTETLAAGAGRIPATGIDEPSLRQVGASSREAAAGC